MAKIINVTALTFSFLATATPTTTIQSVYAANDIRPRSCSSSAFSMVNATGSVRFPGLLPNQPANETWTLSTGAVLPDPSSASLFFWLDTDPKIVIAPSKLPYDGCTIALGTQAFGSPQVDDNTTTTTAAYQGNSCTGMFKQDCYDAVLETVNSNIIAAASSSGGPLCEDLLEPWPAQCENSTSLFFSDTTG